MRKLIVYPESMQKNLELSRGLYYSQKILLELTLRGVSREDAYRIVQRNAMAAWDQKKDFKGFVMQDSDITSVITPQEIEAFCSNEFFTAHVDDIFKRVFER
jgi:adenylosuccinate lyase